MAHRPWTVPLVGLLFIAASSAVAQSRSIWSTPVPPLGASTEAVPGTCGAAWFVLTTDPVQPSCDTSVTLTLQMWLPDSCWTLGGAPVFHASEFEFLYEGVLIDTWEPNGPGCLHMILELPPFRQTVGPLEPGPYVFSAQLESISERHGNRSCSAHAPFEVTCCDELPAAVGGLRLAKTDTDEVLLTWDDVGGAGDYMVFGDPDPASEFIWNLGVFPSGAAGAPILPSPGAEFYLVAARNACGLGPRR